MERENNYVQGKVFVGGISGETSEEILTQHFSRYGEVVKSQVIKFRETGLGKGFGFVTFADSSVIDQLLKEQHIILERTVDVKLAIPKGESHQCQRCLKCQQIQRHNSETGRTNERKIFVGGLSHDLSEDDLKKYFKIFGRIQDANIIFDKVTKTSRGFGFVTYDSEEAVTKVLQKKFHQLNNKSVEVKKAEPREWRIMDTGNYNHNFYHINLGYEMWQIYDCNGIYAPHYWPNHTMVPSWINSINHLGTNVLVPPQSVPIVVPYFTSRYPVNCIDSMHNQVNDERGSPLVGNDSPRGNGEKEADNGGEDQPVKSSQVNTDTENGEKDQSVKSLQVNTNTENGEKDLFVKKFQVNTEADHNGEKDQHSS